ncbi:MAG: hypothetical protein AB7K52_02375 [Phycisphaerales bacterium]
MALDGVSSHVPLHLAQAYGLGQRPPVAPVARVHSAQGGVDRADPAGRIGPAVPSSPPVVERSPGIDLLVGGVVPGSVDFRGANPAPRGALPFYSRPGDANEAATAIRLGRSLDVEG